jgi:hypothetical protein
MHYEFEIYFRNVVYAYMDGKMRFQCVCNDAYKQNSLLSVINSHFHYREFTTEVYKLLIHSQEVNRR